LKKEIIFEDPGISENDFFLLEGENNRQIHKWGLQRVTPEAVQVATLALKIAKMAEGVHE